VSPVGVLASVPVGVRFRTHSPLVRRLHSPLARVALLWLLTPPPPEQVYAGLGGTALDLVNGYHSCKAQRQALQQAEEGSNRKA
jgi:hypothetical protein